MQVSSSASWRWTTCLHPRPTGWSMSFRRSAPSGSSKASAGACPHSSRVAVKHDRLQSRDVQDAHVLLLDGDQVLVMEAGEEARHGLQRQAEVAADLLARHAQVELGGRKAARD